ncbi:MAG TPA: hypothetical protein VGH66_10795 [Acidimicrobiales bacterium]
MIHRTRWRSAAAALVALTIALSSCGSRAPAISPSASAELSQKVQAVVSAATSGDRATAQTQLDQLRADIAARQAEHQITAKRAAQILSAASVVGTELAAVPASTATTAPTPTTTTTTTTTVPSSRLSQPSEPDGGSHGKAHKHGDG